MAIIDDKRLKELERAERKLDALEAGGVDNWQGYDSAMEELIKEEQLEEKRKELLGEICAALALGAYEPSERGAGYSFSQESQDEALGIIANYGVIFEKENK